MFLKFNSYANVNVNLPAGSGSQGAASEPAAGSAVGSGAAAVESAADSVVSRSLGCGGGLGWL